mgnify:FL=1
MEFRYRVFMTVANRLSFSKAAKDHSVSQPAVTAHIRELEKNLGVNLFIRSGNQTLLTHEGELVYEYANQLLTLHTGLISKLNFLKYESEGNLNIGTSDTIGTYILPQLLAKFFHQFPHLKVNFVNGSSGELEEKILNNEIDAAIIEQGNNHQELDYIHLMDDQIVCVTGTSNRDYSNNISLHELKNLPYITEQAETDTSKAIGEYFKKNGLKSPNFHNQIPLKDIETVKNFLIHSDGFSLLPRISIEKELRLNLLNIIPIREISVQRSFQATFSKKADNQKAAHFIKFLFSEYK